LCSRYREATEPSIAIARANENWQVNQERIT
jgi:hypothetical protein